jgi:phasin family protein
MTKTTREQTEAFQTSTEVSGVAFSGFERLSALNLNTTRSAFEDGMAASQSFARVKDVNKLNDLPSPFSKNGSESFVTYFRNMQEIEPD